LTWKLEIMPRAQREMRKLSDSILKRVNQKINVLRNSPFPEGTVKLKSMDGFRFRVGDWRVIYTVDKAEHTVTVYTVCHRSKVYK